MKVRLSDSTLCKVSTVSENYAPGNNDLMECMDIMIRQSDNTDGHTIESLRSLFTAAQISEMSIVFEDGTEKKVNGYNKLHTINTFLTDDMSSLTVRLIK